MKEKLGENRNCETCNIEFYVSPSRLRKNKIHTCSKNCSGKYASLTYSNKVKTNCVICNKELFYKQSHFKQIASPCCGFKCSAEMRKIRNKGDGNTKSLKLSDFDRVFWNRVKNCRLRAESKGMDFDLDYLFLIDLFKKQEGKCHYTGVPMELTNTIENTHSIFSVDRVDSKKGYTKDNVVLCLNIINKFKGDSSMQFFNELCMKIGLMQLKKEIKIKKFHEAAIIPNYQSAGASGFDFHAVEKVVIMPGETAIIGTGIGVGLQEGMELQIRPRSGMSAKTKVRVSNAPGTVDLDFSGEVKIILDNIGVLPYTVNIGDRIAQGVVCPVIRVDFEVVDELEDTERGTSGIGSTGA